jgi:RNA polymerase sigma factor (sigma-70 family)
VDTAARDALVLAHAAWARRVALATVRKLRLHISPDDAIGAAFVALVEAAGRYRPGAVPFDAYANRRIVGSVQDFANVDTTMPRTRAEDPRTYRPPDLDIEPLSWLLSDPAPGPLEHRADVERRELAARLLGHARPREREALRLRYVEGLTLIETGRRMGLSEARAWQLVRDGLERIRGSALAAKMRRRHRHHISHIALVY